VTEFSFYHLLTTPLEAALPKLLERIQGLGLRAVVIAGSEQRVDRLNDLLWSFLPHGAARDGNAALQPIWLTHRDENPNAATVLVLTDGATAAAPERFDRCLDIFDGEDPIAVAAARARYKAAREAGHSMRYFRQTAQGWQQGEAQADK
jgi:DNA polymerase-3 subunit chi